MAAGPGAASGSWRQLCGHERGLAAASGSPRGRAARGRPCEKPGAPRGAVRPLLLVHSLPLQTNSFCLRGGEARPLTSWPIFLCALLSLCLISFSSHVLAVGRLSARQRCAWQVSHGASDGLSRAGTAGQQLPRVPLVSAPSALWPLRSGLRSLAAVQQQERGLGWGSCSAEPPLMFKAAPPLCVAGIPLSLQRNPSLSYLFWLPRLYRWCGTNGGGGAALIN